MTVALGPRAGLLLGMLVGSPQTVGELVALIGKAVDDDAVMEGVVEFAGALGGSPALALRQLHLGGSTEVRRQLKRLQKAGLTQCAQVHPSTSALWWAT